MLYINGTFQQDAIPSIFHTDRGLLLGDGLFETMAITDQQVLYLPQHMDRLSTGAAQLEIPFMLMAEQVQPIIARLLSLNHIKTANAVARLTLSRWPRGLLPPASLSPTLMITVEPYDMPPDKPWILWVTSIRRNESSPLSRMKSLSYGDNILGRMQAVQHGADDALLLNSQGHVAGTSMANIFIVKQGVLTTPPISDGALPGIMRAQVMAEAQQAGQPVREASITLQDCVDAEDMFVTNVLMGRRRAYFVDKLCLI